MTKSSAILILQKQQELYAAQADWCETLGTDTGHIRAGEYRKLAEALGAVLAEIEA